MSRIHWIYGLRICEVHEIGSHADHAGADVVWFRESVDTLPPSADGAALSSRVLGHQRPDGLWTEHVFGAEGVAYCSLEVSLDGRWVHSKSTPAMAPEILEDLFFEPVMRTVLHRLGALSFHAAALSFDGRAILLMGHKGAGKSTLAGALVSSGWKMIADDLVRLEVRDGEWCTTRGRSRLKLWPDSLSATGHSSAGGSLRWPGVLPAAAISAQKMMVSLDSPAEESFPVKALCSLMPRGANLLSVGVDRMPSSLAPLLTAEHLTRDPLLPNMPPVSRGGMLGDLLSKVPVLRLCAPDSLDLLPLVVKELECQLRGFQRDV